MADSPTTAAFTQQVVIPGSGRETTRLLERSSEPATVKLGTGLARSVTDELPQRSGEACWRETERTRAEDHSQGVRTWSGSEARRREDGMWGRERNTAGGLVKRWAGHGERERGGGGDKECAEGDTAYRIE
ncbi:hypothetical protein NDU88_003764 [Pleurodeles waltl]|uniref:Uncharacterized protein n=1 Tax=Pleurodeles waltl TaxID=8319 RepID=A0AAV7LJI2_PLEWA|nr:hypothetical protein NDU88_003764 [Pleurodeles waltl]